MTNKKLRKELEELKDDIKLLQQYYDALRDSDNDTVSAQTNMLLPHVWFTADSVAIKHGVPFGGCFKKKKVQTNIPVIKAYLVYLLGVTKTTAENAEKIVNKAKG